MRLSLGRACRFTQSGAQWVEFRYCVILMLIYVKALPRNGGEKNYLEHLFPYPRRLATSVYASVAVLLGSYFPPCLRISVTIINSLRRGKFARICRVHFIRTLAIDSRPLFAFKLRSQAACLSLPYFCAFSARSPCVSWPSCAKYPGHLQDPHSRNHGCNWLRRVPWTFAAWH